MQIPFSKKQEPEIQSCFDINLKFHHPENVNEFDSLFEELKLQRGRSRDDYATFNNEASDTKVELGNVIKNGIGISGSDNKHGTGSSFDTNTRASRGRWFKLDLNFFLGDDGNMEKKEIKTSEYSNTKFKVWNFLTNITYRQLK